jgi:hypothetical protein
MHAKTLERLLAELMGTSDFSRTGSELQARFESLRGYGRLPRGRENRSQILTSHQVATAVLGLVPVSPGWAGHAATVLQGLKPVGGPEAAFGGAATLKDAMALLLDDDKLRRNLVRLSLSGAEGGTNSSGFASLIFDAEGARRSTDYVPFTAYSLFHAGSNDAFDNDERFAPASREFSLNEEFFERLAHEMKMARAYPSPPEGDGSEYNAEEARQARYKALGVTPRSRYLTLSADNQVTWPKDETLIKFNGYSFVLMPKTAEYVQSIHVDLAENRLDERSGRTAVNRLLSVMSWCDDNFAIAGEGWSGSPVPIPVPKRNLAFTTTSIWVFDRKLPESGDARRALALYREALNAKASGLISYAVLNFFKIVEIKHHARGDVKNWFRDNFAVLEGNEAAKEPLKRFREICGSQQPHMYIYDSCRIAVAHAGKNANSDPDDADEIVRLHIAAKIMQLLARHFIGNEYGISDSALSGD